MKKILLIAILITNTCWAEEKNKVNDACLKFKKEIDDYALSDEERKKIAESSVLSTSFIWENDAFSGTGDIHYTNGMKFSQIDNPCKRRSFIITDYLKGVLNLLLVDPNKNIMRSYSTGYTVGMNMYTPNNIKISSRNRNDRPYAGYLYYGLLIQSTDRVDSYVKGDQVTSEIKKADSFELQLGVVGPAAQQETIQKFVHEYITDSAKPLGWDHQIDNRFTINLSFISRYNQFYGRDKTKPNDSYLRTTWHYGFNAGNMMNFLNAGVMFSFGKPRDNYPLTTIQPSLHDEKSLFKKKVKGGASCKCDAWYLFAGIDYRGIESSIFVEGDKYAAHDIKLISGVYDTIYGFTYINDTDDFKFIYKIIDRSKEFDSADQTLAEPHKIAQIAFEWSI